MREPLWYKARKLVKKGDEVEAYFLILATWNFAGFRYILRRFDLDGFEKTIQKMEPVFERLKYERFATADFDVLKKDISLIYNQFEKHVKQTGATKLMALKNRELFVMWARE